MPHPIAQVTSAESGSVQRVVAERQATDGQMESWDISLFGVADNKAVATDVFGLEAPVSADDLVALVVVILSRSGLEPELPWRVVRDGFMMTGVSSLP